MAGKESAIVIAVCWIAIAVISSTYLWVGGVNFWTNIMVVFMLAIAFTITFGLSMWFLPQSTERRLYRELSELKKEIQELKTRVDELEETRGE